MRARIAHGKSTKVASALVERATQNDFDFGSLAVSVSAYSVVAYSACARNTRAHAKRASVLFAPVCVCASRAYVHMHESPARSVHVCMCLYVCAYFECVCVCPPKIQSRDGVYCGRMSVTRSITSSLRDARGAHLPVLRPSVVLVCVFVCVLLCFCASAFDIYYMLTV